MVGLPFLEGLAPKTARAADGPPPFALFYRRGNGVQQRIHGRNGLLPASSPYYVANEREVERWWPMQTTDAETLKPNGYFAPPPMVTAMATFGATSAMQEIEAYVARTTVVRGLRHLYGTENGHPEGAIQGLTGGGVLYPTGSPDFLNCSALGESIDNVIARQLTPTTPESLYLGVKTQGSTGVSYLKQGATVFPRAAEENLLNVYNELFLPFSEEGAARELLINRRKSVNDLLRSDITSLKNDPRLSAADKDRLALHLAAIRDTEVALASCTIAADLLTEVQGHDPNNINQRVHVIGRLAALAIACNVRRSVVVSVGVPQDIINYSDVPGAGPYEFHALSHRQTTEGGSPGTYPAARDLHHAIDRYHLKQFKQILDLMDAYKFGGESLIDKGVSVHFSDLGAGQHTVTQLPYLYVGGCAGALKVGLYANVGPTPLVRFLNTIGAAVGCKNAGGGPLDDLNAGNNNYLTKNWCNHYYDDPQPALPSNGKPAVTGRIAQLTNV
ncbi:MAG: DUF1552 domain-containing protein [Deltaproteobacteria bacterium]|nr:DUF1552 domain-containing protein [Deltaproteobacteria bacterium]